jgi:hypothetical protein
MRLNNEQMIINKPERVLARLPVIIAASVGLWAWSTNMSRAEMLHGETAITCTNPVSGATWQIKIDYDRATVDSNAARISDSEISWRDASNGWYYRLDRKSGNLTVTLASATGGNFLYDRCRMDN